MDGSWVKGSIKLLALFQRSIILEKLRSKWGYNLLDKKLTDLNKAAIKVLAL